MGGGQKGGARAFRRSADEEAVEDGETAGTRAHDETQWVAGRVVLDALGPQLYEARNRNEHQLRHFVVPRKARRRMRAAGTHRAAQDGPCEPCEADDALRDAVREAHEMGRGHWKNGSMGTRADTSAQVRRVVELRSENGRTHCN